MSPTEQQWLAHLAFGAVLARRLDEAADIYRFLLRFAPETPWLLGLCYCLVNSQQAARRAQAANFLRELETCPLTPQQTAAQARLTRRLQLHASASAAA